MNLEVNTGALFFFLSDLRSSKLRKEREKLLVENSRAAIGRQRLLWVAEEKVKTVNMPVSQTSTSFCSDTVKRLRVGSEEKLLSGRFT